MSLCRLVIQEIEKNMSITDTTHSSARDNLAKLVRSNSGKVEGPASSPLKTPADVESRGGSAPATVVDLSDRAKAIMKRSEADQIVADRLAEQIASTKSEAKPKSMSKSGFEQTKSSSLEDILGLGPSSKAAAGSSSRLDYRGARIDELIQANRQSDGGVKSFSVTEHNVLEVPTSPAEIEQWYKSTGKALVELAQQHPDGDYDGLANAVQHKTVKILNAKDIPGLNFSNSITFSGGEGGAQVNGTHSYNRDAGIFKDPNVNYRVSSNGTILAWPKPNAS